MPAPIRRGRSCCSCACSGCASVLIIALAAFLCVYARSGRYRPGVVPPHPLPAANGYDDYVAAGQMLRANGGIGGIYNTNPRLAGLPVLARNQAVVAANRAALARVRSAFGKECGAPSLRHVGQSYPELATFHDLVLLLAADADVRSARLDYAGAAADAVDGIEMALDTQRGGALAHRLAGIQCEQRAQEMLLKVAEKLPPQDARRLALRLQRIILNRPPLADALREEAAQRLLILADDSTMEQYARQHASQAGGGSATGQGGLAGAVGRIGWRLVKDRTVRDVESYMQAWTDEAAKPVWQRRQVPEPTWRLARVLVPLVGSVAAVDARADARSRLLLVLLSIRADARGRGHLPVSIADVGLDGRMGIDPFSGKPLLCKPKGGGFLLYSVGPDGRDDGGVPCNEDADPTYLVGDLGIGAYEAQGAAPSSPASSYYRRVPHMLPPKLPPGAPPLFP